MQAERKRLRKTWCRSSWTCDIIPTQCFVAGSRSHRGVQRSRDAQVNHFIACSLTKTLLILYSRIWEIVAF